MILYNTFNNLISTLSKLIEKKIIEKYRIAIDQKNEIDVLVVSDNVINKNNFIDDTILESYFNFSLLTTSELEEDFYYSKIFEKDNEIIDFKNSRRKLNNLLSPKSTKMPSLPVVTFYSYKGGMGRSTHLALTATYLARKHSKKIVIIDCDFEAPGFTNFFLEEPNARNYKDGLIEYFSDKQFDDTVYLNQYSWEVSKEFSGDGEIRIIPAGNLNPESEFDNNQFFQTPIENYLEGLSRFDLSSTDYIVKQFEGLISDVNEQFKPDAIFIDSRTGFTDVFGITALQLSSQVVGFFNNSVQTEPGLFQFINSIQEVLKSKDNYSIPIIINAFSDDMMFDEFRQKSDNFIFQKDVENDFILSPFYSFFEYNPTLAKIGTSNENKSWLTKIDRGYEQGYTDVGDKILESFKFQIESEKKEDYFSEQNKNIEIKEDVIDSDFTEQQKRILNNLKSNWPNLYADSNEVDYAKEFSEGRIFYRESMKDIFNFNKYIVLGNKGTGKSYLFQALKNENIVEELKKRAQKTNLKVKFLHLVDKKNDYFINTKFFESYKKEIDEIGDFYSKFWKVYTWKTITEQIKYKNIIDYKPLSVNFSILKDDTGNSQELINFIKDINNIISIEKELFEIDNILNTEQIDLIAIYDNLDLMVEPYKWKDEMASLINFWSFSSYKRIHCKLFLRSDLFKKVNGINNIQSLKNNTISIEWEKEEIFNYFFNLVKRLAKDDFINSVKNFDFKQISDDDINRIIEFEKKFKKENQTSLDEPILRKLCWAFFGQYPDIQAHGESYDWLYKNVMNADETISIRPFLDLLELSIDEFLNDFDKDKIKVILPEKYYTYKPVRHKAVERHFKDLVSEKGNEALEYIFDFIDKNEDYQYYQLYRSELYSLLDKVIQKHSLKEDQDELENLLIINGILKQIGNQKYNFAFLYKYRLGLKNRRKGKRKYF